MSAVKNALKLLSPVKVGEYTLSNRVALSSLTRGRSTNTVPNDAMVKYYTQRASAGLLITEATAISPHGHGWIGAPGIWSEEQKQGWQKVTESVHAKGGHIFLQLWFMGRASHSSFLPNNEKPVSASAIAIKGDQTHLADGSKGDYEVPRALETDEIPGIVEQYKKAAELAIAAGFDGVELHGANGYLIDQFLQTASNERTDQYGGSIENRARFLKEILDAVLSVVPSNKVAIRLSPNSPYNGMGSADFHELFAHVLQHLNTLNLAYVHVIDGLAFGFHKLAEHPFTLKEAHEHYKGVIIGNCGYTQATAEAAVESGDADLIAFGRPYISNPDLVERFANGWELNPDAPYPTWYGTVNMPDPNVGYTDFPIHA